MKKFMVMLFAVVGMLFLAGCADSPKKVATKWMQALVDGKVDEANKYSTSRVHPLNALAVEGVKNDKDAAKEIKDDIKKLANAKEEIDGDTAKVTIEGESKPLTLKKVDNEWKVDVEK